MKYGHYQMIVSVDDSGVLDRTWQDISNAFNDGFAVVLYLPSDSGTGVVYIEMPTVNEDEYMVKFSEDINATTDNPNGYPVIENF